MQSQDLSDAVAWPEDAIEVGRILDAWGIKGGFKVQPFSADPQALFSSRRWFLKPAAETARRPTGVPPVGKAASKLASAATAAKPAPVAAPLPSLLKITHAKEQGDVVVAQAQEVPDRNAAEALRGARVFVSRSSFPTADSDEFYWIDLIGLNVVNRDGASLGVVTDLIETGPHCVLRIRRDDATPEMKPDEAERLVPFVDAFIDNVDLPSRRITVDWGLDY
ncbi:MAG TPA: ribosome maturation factor RimM [Ideonella sp.]|uniref:ribosome maturation factor RimM n=1 Tax=Ideonella sp. TaxID=1929293 RepID=UPI002BDB2643|nr:ribosome maturation factor RimM [Ideonella sp.]HSI46905.1 ribosome maturation factor RimM [Ideonella sp.]